MPSPPWPGPAPAASQILGPAPPPINRGPGTTVHAQIEDWLAELISVGRLAPGDRMPTEQDLAAWLGVSRMTLRHALANLARRGLVTRTVGRRGGTFVAESKLEQDLTTLAGFSEQLRRHGMVAGARVLSATERPAGPVAAAALEVAEGVALYEVRRVRLGDGRPIALEHSLFPAAVFPGMLGCRLDGSLYELLEANYGQRPCRARESLEPVSAGVTGGGGAGGEGRGGTHAGGADRLHRRGHAGGVRPRPVPRRPHPPGHVDLGAARPALTCRTGNRRGARPRSPAT